MLYCSAISVTGLLSGTNHIASSTCYSFHPSVLPRPPRATISPPGIATGEFFSLTCIVTLVVGDSLLDVQWTGPDGAISSSTQQNFTTDDCTTTYTSILELSHVKTSHGGLYKCKASSTGGNGLDTKNLTVQSELMCLLMVVNSRNMLVSCQFTMCHPKIVQSPQKYPPE